MKIPQKIQAAQNDGHVVFSFEYFPPKTAEGVENLFERMDRMVAYQPAFCDITWGAGGSTADLTLDIATTMQNTICVETSMHLTCTNMPVERIDQALDHIKAAGLQNVLALRGDPPHGQDKFVSVEGGFSCALDLVHHIRKKYGDYFGISVAGYPEAHPDAISNPEGATDEEYQKDLEYLKAKMDAGGDLIITQLFYDVDIFLKFVADCRAIGISQPIVPGIMPIVTYAGFKRMTGFCKTKVPASLLSSLEAIKDNDEAVKAFGIDNATQMCRRILDSGICSLHLYTLNMERSALAILQNLGLIDTSKVPRSLPWRPATSVAKRAGEDVRPIHWANRPRSYLSRTSHWDSFPSGRWGASSLRHGDPTVSASATATAALPSFASLPRNGDGDGAPSHPASASASASDPYRQFLNRKARSDKLRAEWAVPIRSEDDVAQLFARHCSGQLSSHPWSERVDGSLGSESASIREQLCAANQAGLLTINSQPAVNGGASDSPDVGWGGPGGYVFQKAYVEFFCPPHKLPPLLARVQQHPSLSLMAVDAAARHVHTAGPGTPAVTVAVPTASSNGGEEAGSVAREHSVVGGRANAVTWGVFPGREVLQPTVVEFHSFMAWKEEAFAAWLQDWAPLYDTAIAAAAATTAAAAPAVGSGSGSIAPGGMNESAAQDAKEVLKKIHDSYFLVSVVENDFVKGNLFELFEDL